MARGPPAASALLLTVGLFVALLAAAMPVAAHADFLRSTPAPFDVWNIDPTYVSVTVSEAASPVNWLR